MSTGGGVGAGGLVVVVVGGLLPDSGGKKCVKSQIMFVVMFSLLLSKLQDLML